MGWKFCKSVLVNLIDTFTTYDRKCVLHELRQLRRVKICRKNVWSVTIVSHILNSTLIQNQRVCFCHKMASETISEHLISKNSGGACHQTPLLFHVYGIHTPCNPLSCSQTVLVVWAQDYVTPLLKILATGLCIIPIYTELPLWD